MSKLDKMIKQANAKLKQKNIIPVHIIEDGYCYACKGECKYTDDTLRKKDGVVLIHGAECILE